VTAVTPQANPQAPGTYYCACSADYANLAPHAMHAHRLWIKLWMSGGQQLENSGQPGGNAGVTGSVRPAVHSVPPPAGRLRTAAVHGNAGADLRGRLISPGSTVPMTTTAFYFPDRSHRKKAAGLDPCRGRANPKRTGGDR
jgi:hypothetical protein